MKHSEKGVVRRSAHVASVGPPAGQSRSLGPRSSVTSGGAPSPITVVPPDLGDGSDEGDDLRPLSRHELRLTLAL